MTDLTRQGDLIAKTHSDNEAENPKERCFLTQEVGQMGEEGEYPPKPTNWRGTTMRRSLTELRLRRGDQRSPVHGRETSGIEAKKRQGREGLAKKCRLERKQGRTPNTHRTNARMWRSEQTEWNDWAELEAPDDQTGEVETHERKP